MGGINATYDNSLDPGTRDVIEGMIDAINAGMQTRSVNLSVTSNLDQLTFGNREKAGSAFNHTSTTHVKNDTLFINKNFDFSTYDIEDPVQSWLHELVHVAFPGIGGTKKGQEEVHELAFYEKLAVMSDLVGVKMSLSDLHKWQGVLLGMGVPPEEIQLRTGRYADKDPNHEAHCFLGGTPVLMADGSAKAIQDVAPGDEVMAFDPAARNGIGAKRPGRVRRVFRNVTKSIIDLRGLRMTPGHLVLSDNGEWLKIADVLRSDRAIVEERAAGPVMVRARTGAVVGSPEDRPVTVLFDGSLGTQHRAVVRAGILSIGEKMADGSSVGWSLARVLQHQGYTIRADGVLVAKDGRRFDATPWPGGSPFDSPIQQNWIVALDGKPFVPSWIADLDEDEARVAIGETDRPEFTRRFDPPMLNRKSRRRMAALQLVR